MKYQKFSDIQTGHIIMFNSKHYAMLGVVSYTEIDKTHVIYVHQLLTGVHVEDVQQKPMRLWSNTEFEILDRIERITDTTFYKLKQAAHDIVRQTNQRKNS